MEITHLFACLHSSIHFLFGRGLHLLLLCLKQFYFKVYSVQNKVRIKFEILHVISVPARLGKVRGAKEIGHNLAREQPKFGHYLVRERHIIGHSLERE